MEQLLRLIGEAVDEYRTPVTIENYWKRIAAVTALRYCAQPNCKNLVAIGRCDDCRRKVALRRQEEPGREWYGTLRWQQLRAEALRLYPLCVDCLAVGHTEPSTDADHVLPHRGDPVLFWDLGNLRGRCHSCHSKKTRKGL